LISGKLVGSAKARPTAIKWCENTLAKSKAFRLPGCKAVAASARVFDTVLTDATETPIERPKKTKALLFGQEEAGHAENSACRGKIDAPHLMPRPATTSVCSRRQKFICILKRKPLSTAAIKACTERTPTRRYRRCTAKRIRYQLVDLLLRLQTKLQERRTEGAKI
jgi:hypothetical protein